MNTHERTMLEAVTGMDDDEDNEANPTTSPTIGDIIAERMDRRDLMRGLLASTVLAAALPAGFMAAGFMAAEPAQAQTPKGGKSAFSFKEVTAGVDGNHHIAEGYDADILIRWGDPIMPDALPFDPMAQTGARQAKQFGYNNDFVGYFPLKGSNRGLLAVNH
ncbi:MAG: DUF839 domain-containing protein, partial [Methylobacterium sp.]|nr:DUF839 domain-containing protein [Methylobacterium sp.]